MTQRVSIQIALNIRHLRAERGISLSELARISGVSKGTLSKLETGFGNPTIETLTSLANSLAVTLDDILSDEARRVCTVRSTEEAWVRGAALAVRLMDRLLGRSVVDVYEATFTHGIRREAEAHVAGTIEHLFLTAGRLLVGPVGEAVELGAGDYIRFPADQPHVYEAIGGDAQAIFLISYLEAPSSRQELQRELEHLLSTGDQPKPTQKKRKATDS